MRLMRRRDPQTKEYGFQLLLPHTVDHIDELTSEFSQEQHRHGLHCWLHVRAPPLSCTVPCT